MTAVSIVGLLVLVMTCANVMNLLLAWPRRGVVKSRSACPWVHRDGA
ncbi:MAG: hypothetical protein U0132_13300 [Gemmatimonadaceae bacterium]